MRKKESKIEEVHACGLLEGSREIFLTGDIDENQLDLLVKNLRILENNNSEPICLYMCTQGGELYPAFGIYDHISNCKSHITIIASGALMSAGTLIIQAADTRLCTANTQILLHNGSNSDEATHKDFMSAAKNYDKMITQMQDIIANRMIKNTKDDPEKTRRLLKNKMSSDWWLSAEEAKSLGIIDDIV